MSALKARFYSNQFFSGGVILASMLVFTILWFFLVHSVRIKELRYRLKTGSDRSSAVRTLSLVTRFSILRHDNGDTGYAREGRIMRILADSAYLNESDELNPAELAAKFTVDVFDLVTNTPPFFHEKSSREYRVLERAFFHEITRNYKEAKHAYNSILDGRPAIQGDMRAYTLLHRGFCHALSGDRQSAIADFEETRRITSEPEYLETAQALLAMLGEIQQEMQKTDAMPLSRDKAKAYYQLTAYNQAVGVLEKIGVSKTDQEGLYYLGRSLEESGNTAGAVTAYRNAIAANPGNAWAVRANRRLFALGSFYAAGKEYRQESRKNVETGVIRDQELLVQANRFEKVSEQIEEGEKKMIAAYIAPAPAEVNPPAAATPAAGPVAPKTAAPTVLPVEKNSEPVPTAAAPAEKKAAPVSAPAAPASAPAAAPAEEGKRAGGPDWERLEKLSRAEKIRHIDRQQKVEMITLENGNHFRGLVVTENKDRVILYTALGRVTILKSEIESRESGPP